MLDGLWERINDLISSWGVAQYLVWLVFLVVGVFFLVKFCDMFVGAASAIAKKLHISPLIIGLTVVAIGTSCPELAVSVSDSIGALRAGAGATANIALGNVIGSNICNIALVLGFSCVFTPILVKKTICKREYPFLLFITALLIVFGLFFGVNGNQGITRWEGIIFVVLIPVYIGFLIYNAKKNPEAANEEEEIADMAMWKAILFVIIGAVGIILGGEFVVYGAKNSAIKVAVSAGWDREMVEALVGLTIVAVGTSLPELVTSIVAAKKGENELALGNVIGSNIFNTIFVLGIASTINPVTTENSQLWVELAVMGVVTMLVFGFALSGKMGKKSGFTLLSIYVLFVVYLVVRTVIL